MERILGEKVPFANFEVLSNDENAVESPPIDPSQPFAVVIISSVLQCEFCDLLFSDTGCLLAHAVHHRPIDGYECQPCKIRCATAKLLIVSCCRPIWLQLFAQNFLNFSFTSNWNVPPSTTPVPKKSGWPACLCATFAKRNSKVWSSCMPIATKVCTSFLAWTRPTTVCWWDAKRAASVS
jgi:uncharacterized protein YlaI